MVLHVTVGQPRELCGAAVASSCSGLAEEGVHLADVALNGWAVGQVGLERAPDPLNRVVVRTGADPCSIRRRGYVCSQRWTILGRWMITLSQITATTGAVG